MTGQIKRGFVPPTDIVEMHDRLLIVAEIAGMQPDDFSISLFNRRLVISGVRRPPLEDFKALHRLEIGYGDFRIDVMLPYAVEGDQVTASYRDGFLQIELPRRPDVSIPVMDVGAQKEDTHE
jgi:HSP20 family protein